MDTGKIIKERQTELMEYLRFTDRICRKENIRYSLSFGSLLGAVRHEGFIPWDDDLDLSFEREEFYKFKRAVEKEADETFTLIKELWIHRLVSKNYRNEQIPKMLDCFIYDAVPKKTITRKIKIFLLRCLQGMLKHKPDYRKYRGVQKALVFFCYQLGRLFPYELKFAWYQKAAQIGNNNPSKYVNTFDDDYSGLLHQIPISDVTKWKNITFETQQFMAPLHADNVLKILYGDYMTLPPIEKRVPIHWMEKKTKILLLTNSTNGLFSFRKELIEELIYLKYDVSICSPVSKESGYFEKLGCHIIDIHMSNRGTNPIKDLALMRNYVKILKTVKPNVVLTYTVKPNVYGGIACSLNRIPYLTNITGLGDAMEHKGILSSFVMGLYRMGIQKASCVFFQNTSNQAVFREKKLLKGKYKLLPGSGVNLNNHTFEDYPEDNGALHFLFVGRLLKTKGIEELLSSIPFIKNKYPETVFSLVGEITPAYEERMKKMEQAGVLKTYGYCSEVHEFMKKSHAIVLPSYHEGTANVLLEGAATGRPILASRVPGCRETFDEGITGIGFEAKDAKDLCRAIEAFIQLPYEKKAEMGKQARIKMEQEYNRQIVTQAYIQEIKLISQ